MAVVDDDVELNPERSFYRVIIGVPTTTAIQPQQIASIPTRIPISSKSDAWANHVKNHAMSQILAAAPASPRWRLTGLRARGIQRRHPQTRRPRRSPLDNSRFCEPRYRTQATVSVIAPENRFMLLLHRAKESIAKSQPGDSDNHNARMQAASDRTPDASRSRPY